ncbi:MAG: ATP-dependent helicase, partial [Lachnospiraceae bacterium]|nr:ATP-dependent helicase [Lachnospiraceae bacterium]
MLNNLNNNQKKAVVTNSRYVRIIAGAGSGKTRVLTSRIAWLIKNKMAFPNQILAITFTNKAANEMKERVSRMMEQTGTMVWISTIHSLCVRILREDIVCMGMPRNFTVMDADDQKAILKEAYKELGLDKTSLSFSSALDYISANK